MQVRQDASISTSQLGEQHAKAAALITRLKACEDLLPHAKPLMAALTEDVTAFYSGQAHRGWTQQFALQGMDKLELLWPITPLPNPPEKT